MKHNFKAALDDLNNVSCKVTAMEWFEKYAGQADHDQNPVAVALSRAIHPETAVLHDLFDRLEMRNK